MTKVEQLKARAYVIDILEETAKQKKDQIKYITESIEEDEKNGVETSDWEKGEREEAKKQLQMIEYIIEEIAK